MTVTSPTKICRDCGAEFRRSPADRTVRCPYCRVGPVRVEDRGQTQTCTCDKTVVAYDGRPTGNVCPRWCDR